MSSNSNRAMQWAKDNPDRFKENQKRYRDKKKLNMSDEEREIKLKKQREQSKRWRLDHPDEVRERKNNYIKKRRLIDPDFREKILKRKRDWDKENKEHNRLYKLNRYKNSSDVRKKYSIRSINKNYNNRLEVIYWYSDGSMVCKNCGNHYYEFLAVDHMNNDGYAHRSSGELKKYSNNICTYLVANNFPDGYQILCHNCNQLKRYDGSPNVKDTAYTRHRVKRKKMMLEKYSTNGVIKCKYCDADDVRCLTFHHVNGGGTKERRDLKYSSIEAYLYKNNIPLDQIEVLCQNCNKSLGHYGYLPFDQQNSSQLCPVIEA